MLAKVNKSLIINVGAVGSAERAATETIVRYLGGASQKFVGQEGLDVFNLLMGLTSIGPKDEVARTIVKAPAGTILPPPPDGKQ